MRKKNLKILEHYRKKAKESTKRIHSTSKF